MLEKAARDDQSGVAIKPLSFYQSCMNRTERTQIDAEAFLAFLRRLGLTWPEMPPNGTNALGSILELNYKLASPIWLTIRVVHNKAAGGKRRRIVLKPCCMDRLKFFVFQNRWATDHKRYYDYWTSHYEALMGRQRLSRNPEQIDKLATEEADIVGKLEHLSHVTPTAPLVLHLSEIGRRTKKLPAEYWLTEINNHIAGGPEPAFTLQDEVLVSDASVLKCLDNLFDNYSPEQLVDHLSWQFVQLHAWSVDRSLLDFRGANYLRINEPMLCAREVEDVYRPLLATLYVQQHLSKQERLELNANLSDLKETAAKMYTSATWLDQTDKNMAANKLRAMDVNLWPQEAFFDPGQLRTTYAGFPDENTTATSWVRLWISAQERLRSLAGTSIHDATANMRSMLYPALLGYDYLSNQVDIAVSSLGKPLYCPQATPGLFYGSLAFSFAKEMMKMQDTTGLRVHWNGELVQAGRWSWLSDSAAAAYKLKAGCLGADPVNLSDIAALEVVYKALSRGVRNTTSLLQMSRDIDEQKTFFMALCFHSCAVNESHSPTVNCNALLRHSRKFSEVFHCKTGSPMNPYRKCSYF
ncbi:hypothetical protein V5799_006351 [Amblyomma americanum]|uniref:Peptidase M13 N-terminal domain-containing protein n=1 Tax=Amblyomma americanum TaxID=6943 RepID=A0AAQ4DWM6_AMBAM